MVLDVLTKTGVASPTPAEAPAKQPRSEKPFDIDRERVKFYNAVRKAIGRWLSLCPELDDEGKDRRFLYPETRLREFAGELQSYRERDLVWLEDGLVPRAELVGADAEAPAEVA
jgi:hypothetical protein